MKGINITSRKLKNGKLSWGYRFEGAQVNGHRHQISKSGFSSKKEAQKEGILALRKYEDTGCVYTVSDMSFSDYLDVWFKEDCMVDLKNTTLENYYKKIENHIKPSLGSNRLSSIKKADLQALISDMFDRGYSKNTLSSIIGILTKSFNYAVDHNYISSSPAIRIKIPKNRQPNVATRTSYRVIINDDVIEEVFVRFPESNPNHIPLRLGYECGMRIGEAYALVWEDIDFEAKTITINRQVQWKKDLSKTSKEKVLTNGMSESGSGHWYFSNPKYNSFRTIAISDSLTELLRREYKRQEAMKLYYGDMYTRYYSEMPLSLNDKNNPSDSFDNPITTSYGYQVNFVCVRSNGTYISPRTMQHASSVIQKNIFEQFTFHSLRHTHASILYANNLNDKYISERLGHKDSTITKEVYIHLTDQIKEHGDNMINQLF